MTVQGVMGDRFDRARQAVRRWWDGEYTPYHTPGVMGLAPRTTSDGARLPSRCRICPREDDHAIIAVAAIWWGVQR